MRAFAKKKRNMRPLIAFSLLLSHAKVQYYSKIKRQAVFLVLIASKMYSTSRIGSSGAATTSMNGTGEDNSAAAAADLVLLQQNLGKSKRVTTRITALLTSFDDRLARLEKSVVPIHRSTKDLSKIQRNVEAALLAIDSVVGTNDLVDREQEVIDRSPKEDLPAYQASLNRLKAALESMQKSNNSPVQIPGLGAMGMPGGKGKEREGTLGRVKGLIDVGCRRIGDLFLETVHSVSPELGWMEIASWDEGTTFPTLIPQLVSDHLTLLLGFLRTILGQGSQLEKDLQRGYGEIRGLFMATTLNQVGREAIDGIEVQTRAGDFATGRLPALGRRGFGRFIDAMFAMAKVSATSLQQE